MLYCCLGWVISLKLLARTRCVLPGSNIVLTKRGSGSEGETALAEFPHHALNTYLPKLVKAGPRVAICDQLVFSPWEILLSFLHVPYFMNNSMVYNPKLKLFLFELDFLISL